jgi:starvation-inducible outer membrane lipoprotein
MKISTILAVLCGALVLSGCGDDPIDESKVQNPSQEQMDAAKARRDEIFAIYDRAGGKWESMTAADKQRLLELSNNDEGMARQGWEALKLLPRN